MAADTAKLVASLELKDSLSKGLATAGRNVDGFSRKLAGSRAVAVGLGVGLERVAAKGLSALGNAIGDGITEAQLLEKANQQTAAAIASTGGVAGVTAQQVRDLASVQEDLTTADDKTIQQGENLLLTFTKIGKKTFPLATAAMVNMAIAMNKGDAATADFDGTAIQLGKALQDPLKGITALQRVGVTFSKQQKAQIADLVKHGKLEQAQGVILAELTKEFGKAGAAAGTGFTADVNRANDAIKDAEASLATGLMPAIGEVARALSTTLKDPATLAGLKAFGTSLGEGLKGAVAFAKTIPWDKVGQGLSIAAEAAKTVVGAFTSLPPWVQAAVVSGWGLNKITGGALSGVLGSLAGGLGKGLLEKLGLMRITAGVVQVSGPLAPGSGGTPAGAAAGAAKGGLSTIAKVALVGEAIGLVLAVNEVRDGISAASTAQATQVQGQTAAFIASQPNKADLQTALAGVNQGIHDLEFNPLNVLVQGEALDKLRGMRADLEKAIANSGGSQNVPGGPAFAPVKGGEGEKLQAQLATIGANILKAGAQRDAETSASIAGLSKDLTPISQTADIETLRGNIAAGLSGLDTSVFGVKQATDAGASRTSSAATGAGQAAARQTFASGLGIEGAIAANRPITNVKVEISATNVTRVNVVANRGGDRNSSRDGDGGGGPGQ